MSQQEKYIYNIIADMFQYGKSVKLVITLTAQFIDQDDLPSLNPTASTPVEILELQFIFAGDHYCCHTMQFGLCQQLNKRIFLLTL